MDYHMRGGLNVSPRHVVLHRKKEEEQSVRSVVKGIKQLAEDLAIHGHGIFIPELDANGKFVAESAPKATQRERMRDATAGTAVLDAEASKAESARKATQAALKHTVRSPPLSSVRSTHRPLKKHSPAFEPTLTQDALILADSAAPPKDTSSILGSLLLPPSNDGGIQQSFDSGRKAFIGVSSVLTESLKVYAEFRNTREAILKLLGGGGEASKPVSVTKRRQRADYISAMKVALDRDYLKRQGGVAGILVRAFRGNFNNKDKESSSGGGPLSIVDDTLTVLLLHLRELATVSKSQGGRKKATDKDGNEDEGAAMPEEAVLACAQYMHALHTFILVPQMDLLRALTLDADSATPPVKPSREARKAYAAVLGGLHSLDAYMATSAPVDVEAVKQRTRAARQVHKTWISSIASWIASTSILRLPSRLFSMVSSVLRFILAHTLRGLCVSLFAIANMFYYDMTAAGFPVYSNVKVIIEALEEVATNIVVATNAYNPASRLVASVIAWFMDAIRFVPGGAVGIAGVSSTAGWLNYYLTIGPRWITDRIVEFLRNYAGTLVETLTGYKLPVLPVWFTPITSSVCSLLISYAFYYLLRRLWSRAGVSSRVRGWVTELVSHVKHTASKWWHEDRVVYQCVAPHACLRVLDDPVQDPALIHSTRTFSSRRACMAACV